MRTGHDALFHLADPGADYISSRTSELDPLVHSKGGITVGLHIRHGDRRPWEFQYKESYIPPSNYLDAARAMISSHFQNDTAAEKSTPMEAELASQILLASDDPDVYDSLDFSPATIVRAQSQILLASKTTLDATLDASAPKPPPSEDGFTKFIETNVGWEGGFFPNVFWGLGTAAKVASSGTAAEEGKRFGDGTMALRELVARAYLLDLKVLGGSDRVVCAVSSVGCRLLAVMMGWERAVVRREWRNVDGGFGWVGFEEE